MEAVEPAAVDAVELVLGATPEVVAVPRPSPDAVVGGPSSAGTSLVDVVSARAQPGMRGARLAMASQRPV